MREQEKRTDNKDAGSRMQASSVDRGDRGVERIMTRQSFSQRSLRIALAVALLFLSLFAAIAQAQTDAPQRPKKRVPTLTNDDFEMRRSSPAAAPASAGDSAASKPAGAPDAVKEPASEPKKADAEELAWREKIAKARARVTELMRASQSAELRVIDLKDSLSASNRITAADINQTNSALDAARAESEALKSQLDQARLELNALVQTGREKKYEEAAPAKAVNDDGSPNTQYYADRRRELTEQYKDAMREERLYELKTNELRQRLQTGKKGADEFYLAPIREELNDTLAQLDRAREALAKAQEALDELMEQARRAGIEPGSFR